MAEPHEIFRPVWEDEILYITPDDSLSWDLAFRFPKVVAAVPVEEVPKQWNRWVPSGFHRTDK